MSAITALLFPGQGSQYVGMGHDLYDVFPQAQAVFDQADDQLEGVPLLDLMFGDPDDMEAATKALKQTEITQPALFVHSMAAMSVLSSAGVVPDMVAGHSLGEYSALAAAEAITFADGLALVRERGLVMSEAGSDRPGAMAALIGMEDSAVEEICNAATAATPGVVQAANYNAPGQVVISGDSVSVEEASRLARNNGARKIVALPVSGAFHSPLMEPARELFASTLRDVVIREPICPVYLNVTARPTRDPEAIRAALLLQLTSPVRWVQTIRNMKVDGSERFIEVGSGAVLSGLVKRTIGRETETQTAGKVEDVTELLGGFPEIDLDFDE